MTSDGQQLYCRGSDTTCQVRLTTIGADCRNDPVTGCTAATAADGTTTPLYCNLSTFQCAAKVGAGASCASNPAQACADIGSYCSSNRNVCVVRQTGLDESCNADPYAQCGLNPDFALTGHGGQLFPVVRIGADGNRYCFCSTQPAVPSEVPPPGTFGLTSIGEDCSADPTFACGYSSTGIKLYCALSSNTCQAKVTTAGQSCAYDYLGACGVTSDGIQLYPSVPVGSPGHADCTCVTQPDVIARPSSRARARARERRYLSLCPGSYTACPAGSGFECVDTSVSLYFSSQSRSASRDLCTDNTLRRQSDIEQCGGCSGDERSVDCTAIDGIAAVGCVDGRCEVWACEDGYEFAAEKDRCVRI